MKSWVWRPTTMRQVVCGVDQRHVAEGLRHVAEHAAVADVVLLGEQADVVAKIKQPLVEITSFVVPVDQIEIIGEPERTCEERTLPSGESVDRVLPGAIAQQQPVVAELALYCLDGADDTWVLRWQEPDLRDEQQRCVRLLAAVALD